MPESSNSVLPVVSNDNAEIKSNAPQTIAAYSGMKNSSQDTKLRTESIKEGEKEIGQQISTISRTVQQKPYSTDSDMSKNDITDLSRNNVINVSRNNVIDVSRNNVVPVRNAPAIVELGNLADSHISRNTNSAISDLKQQPSSYKSKVPEEVCEKTYGVRKTNASINDDSDTLSSDSDSSLTHKHLESKSNLKGYNSQPLLYDNEKTTKNARVSNNVTNASKYQLCSPEKISTSEHQYSDRYSSSRDSIHISNRLSDKTLAASVRHQQPFPDDRFFVKHSSSHLFKSRSPGRCKTEQGSRSPSQKRNESESENRSKSPKKYSDKLFNKTCRSPSPREYGEKRSYRRSPNSFSSNRHSKPNSPVHLSHSNHRHKPDSYKPEKYSDEDVIKMRKLKDHENFVERLSKKEQDSDFAGSPSRSDYRSSKTSQKQIIDLRDIVTKRSHDGDLYAASSYKNSDNAVTASSFKVSAERVDFDLEEGKQQLSTLNKERPENLSDSEKLALRSSRFGQGDVAVSDNKKSVISLKKTNSSSSISLMDNSSEKTEVVNLRKRASEKPAMFECDFEKPLINDASTEMRSNITELSVDKNTSNVDQLNSEKEEKKKKKKKRKEKDREKEKNKEKSKKKKLQNASNSNDVQVRTQLNLKTYALEKSDYSSGEDDAEVTSVRSVLNVAPKTELQRHFNVNQICRTETEKNLEQNKHSKFINHRTLKVPALSTDQTVFSVTINKGNFTFIWDTIAVISVLLQLLVHYYSY